MRQETDRLLGTGRRYICAHTTRGLILREAKYKESDKILTILTETEGKITAKARGVARCAASLGGDAASVFSEMTLFGNKGYWTINEATTVEQFRGLRKDIERLALGSYIAELLEAVSDEDCPEPEILQLGLNSLYALASGTHPQELVKAAFELRLMCLPATDPSLRAARTAQKWRWSLATSSLPTANSTARTARDRTACLLDGAVIKAMRYIVDAEPKRIFSFRLDAEALKRLGQVCEAYLLYELDRGFASLDYYKKVRK